MDSKEGAEALCVLDYNEAVDRAAVLLPLLAADQQSEVDGQQEVPLQRVQLRLRHARNLRVPLVPAHATTPHNAAVVCSKSKANRARKRCREEAAAEKRRDEGNEEAANDRTKSS